MSKSIISNEKECLICGNTYALHRHHVYFGTANRKLSESHGCWCYLCPEHHNMSNFGVHNNRAVDMYLKRKCQKILEEDIGWTREYFMDVFGRSYL